MVLEQGEEIGSRVVRHRHAFDDRLYGALSIGAGKRDLYSAVSSEPVSRAQHKKVFYIPGRR